MNPHVCGQAAALPPKGASTSLEAARHEVRHA